MITDKDREEAVNVISAYLGGGTEAVEKELSIYRTELAEKARKEAAERVTRAWREHGEGITLRTLRTAILDDSTTDRIPDTGGKLAIAVKALEYVASKSLPSSVFESHYSRLQDACAKASDALKEMQE